MVRGGRQMHGYSVCMIRSPLYASDTCWSTVHKQTHRDCDIVDTSTAAVPDSPFSSPTTNSSHRGIEETAGRILKLLNDRRGDSSPQWVEELHRSHAATAAAASAAAGEVDGTPARPVPEQSGVYSSEHFLMQGLY